MRNHGCAGMLPMWRRGVIQQRVEPADQRRSAGCATALTFPGINHSGTLHGCFVIISWHPGLRAAFVPQKFHP